ncbi:MAG: tRNA (adenosine(37)-N6)-threonylcarbamoyltransferase complex ATPase subunit type 1 TsaE [Gemmatimonas sp.]|nr:tRNA (adenosine(37)-N6)-threonylcarbamoyltransferase complex ATPase subunit type 1 TsaE [Gemmatimonas sp.]
MASLNEVELQDWGRRIGQAASPPLVIALRGDLGTGKTTLARAIAEGAGVEGPVPSPTYNLLFRYWATEGRHVVHIDLFRIQHESEVWELGWEELPSESEIVLIEWPESAEEVLPEPRWEIRLREAESPDARLVTLEAVGEPSPIPDPGG